MAKNNFSPFIIKAKGENIMIGKIWMFFAILLIITAIISQDALTTTKKESIWSSITLLSHFQQKSSN